VLSAALAAPGPRRTAMAVGDSSGEGSAADPNCVPLLGAMRGATWPCKRCPRSRNSVILCCPWRLLATALSGVPFDPILAHIWAHIWAHASRP